ncbi:putative proteinase IV [Symbiobacterium thermophilum IAM 14863]|uniref:Peptidase S49 domain-containing protein n=2 Tax=Symbiobacterium thermophilum TaxID=2734 RepID=Q67KM1_SYMTH|nr:putative proteinase IV [Symbiobacterium thermophilum IAM 14863]
MKNTMKRWIAAGAIVAIVVLSLAVAFWQGTGREVGSPKGPSGGQVALVRVEGTIVSGEGSGSLLSGAGAGSETIVKHLDRAAEDPAVKAVVLRVNSPGGSVVASWEIAEAVRRVQDAGKPVVVSMGESAASGGYWISAGADRIIASPDTMTGSIGVILQVGNLSEVYEKVGYKTYTFKSGPFKDMGSPDREMTDAERDLLQDLVDETYEAFVPVVAEGRGMDEAQVRKIADGRILTGRKALELGLVDELGDLKRAVQVAAELAGLPGEPEVREMNRANGLLGALLGRGILPPASLGLPSGLYALEPGPVSIR